jgi:hypothetical protein
MGVWPFLLIGVLKVSKQWAKSTNGPDWIDLRAMMIAIGAIHSAKVEVIISPLGIGSTGSVTVECAAHFDLLPGSSLPETVVVNGVWPTAKAATVQDLAYNLLWRLDYQIGEVYKQEGLWAE